MSKSPFKIAGISTGINLSRLGNFSFTPETMRQKQSRLGVQALNAQKNIGTSGTLGLGDLQGAVYNTMGPGNSVSETANQVVESMPDASSSLVNPFGLQAQGAIGGTFGSLFDRQNSMGSALAKRACKYKNKK